jgi:hypothetical protein
MRDLLARYPRTTVYVLCCAAVLALVARKWGA